MSQSIRVDDQVYAKLKENAEVYESPNNTLRRLLGLEPELEVKEDNKDGVVMVEDLVELVDAKPTPTKKGAFYANLPMLAPRTIRHERDVDFVILAKAINDLLKAKFKDRFTSVVHRGSVSWLEGSLCMFKLNFHGKEAGIFEGEEGRLKAVFGVRRELADKNPDLGKLTSWDRQFKVSPDYNAVFVGFAVDNDSQFNAKIKKVIDAIK